MNIHEYQAKAILKAFGVPGRRRRCRRSRRRRRRRRRRELGGPVWVVKAQIHAGGRGKGRFKEKEAGEKGGVRLARSVEEVRRFAEEMLGRTLVTHQTGPQGKRVNRLYIEQGSDIAKEFYLSLLVDRASSAGRLRRLDRGRHEHRGGRGEDAGEDRLLLRRSGDRLHAASRPPHRAGARPRRAISPSRRRSSARASTTPSSPRT